jgi:hypothetical protein
MNRLLASTIAVLLAAGLAGCSVETDLGQTCKMTRPDTEGGAPIELEASSITSETLDWISFGAAECDDLVCVRTAGSPNPAHENGMARGYCTKPCIDASDCAPDFQGRKGAMGCEQLLPDLEELKRTNPEEYERIFGSGTATNYCVLPR